MRYTWDRNMYTKIQSVNSERVRTLVEVMIILKWISKKIV